MNLIGLIMKEEIIDILHEPHIGTRKKPQTYCRQARKNFLAVAKSMESGFQAHLLEDHPKICQKERLAYHPAA